MPEHSSRVDLPKPSDSDTGTGTVVSMRNHRFATSLVVGLAFLAAACGGGVSITADEERWCRSDPVALTQDAVAVAFDRVNDRSYEEAKASYGYTEPDGEQVGSRMTVTNRGGFPDAEAQDAWFASDEFVAACRAAFDDYN